MTIEATRLAGEWLDGFAADLGRGDVAAAVGRLAPDSYWRDLVAFTWNIATFEGPEAIGAMLAATLGDVRPGGFRIEGSASDENGVVSAWFGFETAVARGRGHLRLRDGKGWTLFTAMRELKGHEEHQGATREEGVVHGALAGGRQTSRWESLGIV